MVFYIKNNNTKLLDYFNTLHSKNTQKNFHTSGANLGRVPILTLIRDDEPSLGKVTSPNSFKSEESNVINNITGTVGSSINNIMGLFGSKPEAPSRPSIESSSPIPPIPPPRVPPPPPPPSLQKDRDPFDYTFIKSPPPSSETRLTKDSKYPTARITVMGVGGAGGNVINFLIEKKLQGVEFVSCNTDAQALSASTAAHKLQLGRTVTKGLGAGSKPEMGKKAAEESMQDIIDTVKHSNMLFITAGMGGGTGTGAAPVISGLARERGILTVGIVTLPFHFEGKHRMQVAIDGIKNLENAVDSLIVIPNQRLVTLSEKHATMSASFKMVDMVLYDGIKAITDLIAVPGKINVDFADVTTTMKGMGRALIGLGEAEGPNRSKIAATAALHNPMLEEYILNTAKGVLINIAGGQDLETHEVGEIAQIVHDSVDPEANIIFGSTEDPTMQGKIKVSLIVTGLQPKSPLEVNTHKTARTEAPPVVEKKETTQEQPPQEEEEPNLFKRLWGFFKRNF